MTEDARDRPARVRVVRTALVGGASLVGAAAAVGIGQRLLARRLRSRDDPDAGTPLGLLPPDDLGPVTSFDGTRLAVRAAGPPDAPALVFCHGITLDMTLWHYQWQRFSDRYRCVVYDHRAHGRSGKPPTGDYSLRAIAADLRDVLDAVAPHGPVALVGHSMGGMAILALAEAHPEEFGDRVRGVVLVDTAASDLIREIAGALGPIAERAIRRLSRLANVDRAGHLQRWSRRFGADTAFLIARATNFGPDASPSVVDHVARISRDTPPEVWVHTLRDLFDMDLRDALANVTVPALVVVGDRDHVTPKTSAEALRDALPDARAVVVTRAGHVSFLEQHRVFNDLLADFLAGLDLRRRGRRRRGAGGLR